MNPFIRYTCPEYTKQPVKIFAPCNTNCGSPYSIFKYEVPANDPCYEFSHCRITISICTTGNRYHRCKFSITQPRECTTNSSDYKSYSYRRACMLSSCSSGSHK